MASHYINARSPFGHPHIVGDQKVDLCYADYNDHYTPSKPVCVGGWIATTAQCYVAGICLKKGPVPRKKGIWCTIKDGRGPGRNRIVPLRNCVGGPSKNEFVRDKNTLQWFKVDSLFDAEIKLYPVFNGPPPPEPIPAPAPAPAPAQAPATIVCPPPRALLGT